MPQDFRYALRQLLKNPGFSIVAVLDSRARDRRQYCDFLRHRRGAPASFALSGGGPAGYRGRGSEAFQFAQDSRFAAGGGGLPQYGDFVFRIGAVENSTAFTLTGSGNPEIIPGMSVTASMFSMLGVKPVAGGLFTAEASSPAKIMSPSFRKACGSGASAAIRRSLGKRSRSIGKLRGPGRHPSDSRIPSHGRHLDADSVHARQLSSARGAQYLDVIGRLKPGLTLEQANAEFKTIAARLAHQYPRFIQAGVRIFARSLSAYRKSQRRFEDSLCWC